MRSATLIPLLATLVAAQTAIVVGPTVVFGDATTSAAATASGINLSPSSNGANSTGTTVINTGSQCPADQFIYSYNAQQFCCPSEVLNDENGIDEAYCCVGAPSEVNEECFPFCDDGSSALSSAAPSCATSIPLTASDYSSLAPPAASTSGGSASVTDSGTTSAETGASASGSSSSSSSSGAEGQDGEAGQNGADASSVEGSASSSDNAARAMMTSRPLAGMIVAAGGLLMAL